MPGSRVAKIANGPWLFWHLPGRYRRFGREPSYSPPSTLLPLRLPLCLLVCSHVMLFLGCRDTGRPANTAHSPASAISVALAPGGLAGAPVVITTPAAEFDVLPSGYLKAYSIQAGKRLTLDDPDSGPAAAEYLVSGGRVIDRFTFLLKRVRVSAAQGKLGPRGKRVEIPSRDAAGIERTLAIEVYDNFPALAITTCTYRNTNSRDLPIDWVITQRHRLNAHLAHAGVAPYQLWSFQGSSYEWGKDDVFPIPARFSQPNLMAAMTARGEGGGIPVNAFWTAAAGEAIGHLETLPLVLSMPVKTTPDGRVETSLEIQPKTVLKPGETFSTPRSFVAVYHGDYYEPLRLYSQALEREGWNPAKPHDQDYNISWCGWGYESEVTPAQMLGTIPKLKEFGIKWATLDDRWFENYGDWEPRKDTFPGDSLKQMVSQFHKQGIFVQLWWLPLGVEDGEGRRESHHYGVAEVVRQHPDWLILDQQGRHAHMARRLGALCPALPEVQDYYRKLTEKFIRDWDFDGHKLDNIFTVPACYNPKHHHASPEDSIKAMGEVFRVILETTRALKPESVTQACPCGTPPNLAWLPYLDQAVTADPVGSVQVRRRIKMYKALLGPRAAVYGDHVELTAIRNEGNTEIDYGKDFASTLGTGGVVGTKFVWPDPGPHFSTVLLTPAKERLWKKWTGLYNTKMLSRGDFLDFYTIGYDIPEGYAIAKDGKMYYAFFAPDPAKPWKGEVELRGLGEGRYSVLDYENHRRMGEVDGRHPKLRVEFTHHLLLEARTQ